jgi:hypothetical protein
VLLLTDAGQADPDEDSVWPWTDTGATRWVADLHDEIERSGREDLGHDRGRIASWLRVQAVGRDTIRISDPRLPAHAADWAAAAQQAGIAAVRVLHPDGSAAVVTAGRDDAHALAPSASPTIAVGTVHRVQNWLADRAEAGARIVIRAVQR